MKKKVILIIAAVVIASIMLVGIISWMFSSQYNSHGISHFLVVTIDSSQPQEYVGKLDDHDVYIEGLKLDETNFRTIDAENLSVKDAITKKVVSISEWRKYAFRKIKVTDGEILRYDRYEILVTSDTCIIRPITK